jgi:hypothetical protein
MSIFAVKASIDSQSALIKAFLSSFVSLGVEIAGIPKPYCCFKSVMGKSSISGVVNEVVADSLSSVNVVVSASDLDGASSLESLSVTRVSVTQILSAFVFSTGGDFFHIVEGAGFFSDLAEESRDSVASVDVTSFHSSVKIRKVLGEVGLVTSRHDKLELMKAEAHGRGNSEDEGEEKESRSH